MSRARIGLLLCCFTLALAPPARVAAAASYDLSVIALRDDPAPGTATTFRGFFLPISITDTGAAFVADLTGIGGSENGIFADVGSGVVLIAVVGDPTPGGRNFASFTGIPSLNASGDLVFFAATFDGVTGRDGLFRWDSTDITALIVEGDPAPGTGLTFISPSQGHSQNDAGVVVVSSTVDDGQGGSMDGLFLHESSGITTLAWQGDSAPGTGGGEFLYFASPVINNDGDVVFVAAVTNGTTAYGIFRISGGMLETLIVEGDPLPGTSGGTADSISFSKLDLNRHGTVVFTADVLGSAVDRGTFAISSGGAVTTRVLEGDAAPGTGAGILDHLFRNPAVDDTGAVAYVANITNAAASKGLFRGDDAIALVGDLLPGTGGGLVSGPSSPADLSASGHVGFHSGIFNGTTTQGLFRATPTAIEVPALPLPAIILLVTSLAAVATRRLSQ